MKIGPAVVRAVRRRRLDGYSEVRENLAYWQSRSPEERVAAVDHLRRTHAGGSARLRRVARVLRRAG